MNDLDYSLSYIETTNLQKEIVRDFRLINHQIKKKTFLPCDSNQKRVENLLEKITDCQISLGLSIKHENEELRKELQPCYELLKQIKNKAYQFYLKSISSPEKRQEILNFIQREFSLIK